MHLIVIGILSLVLAFRSPPVTWLSGGTALTLAVAAAVLLPAAAAAAGSRRVLHRLEHDPQHPQAAQAVFGRTVQVSLGLLGLLHSGLLLTTAWLDVCRGSPAGRWPLAADVLALLPFLGAVTLLYPALYPGERAIRQLALEQLLLRGRPVHPVWTCRQYVAFQLRHQVLFIVVPMLAILLARDLLERLAPHIADPTARRVVTEGLFGLSIVVVAVLTPAALRYIWSTAPLPAGPLRDRLLWLCRRLGLRCRDILVWRSGGAIANAAVMGLIAPLRYVLITDALLEQMDDTRIEAVFGHEAGHIKRHHILFFLLFAVTSGCLLTVFSVYTAELDPAAYRVAATAAGGALVLKWAVGFGWLSRTFERQADVFGVQTLVLAGVPCAGPCALHAPQALGLPHAPPRAALCLTAASIFGDTLYEVAALNGIPPQAWSWRHGSISARSRALLRLARDPRAARRFERTVRRAKLVILFAAAASGLWAAWALRVWEVLARLAG